MSCNSFSLINRSFLLHTARKYCFLPKKFLVPFILNFSNSDAWLRLPVSITIISKFQHPAVEWEVEIHSRAHLARTNRQFLFRFPFALCFLLEVHFWEIVQGSLFMASVNAASNVSVGMDEHVNRSLAGQEESARFRLNLWIHKPEAPRCTWPAGDGGREGVLRLTTCFFLFLTSSHHSRSLRGAERSQRSLSSGSGSATRGSGLQKNSFRSGTC